jgi:hypothetical protein
MILHLPVSGRGRLIEGLFWVTSRGTLSINTEDIIAVERGKDYLLIYINGYNSPIEIEDVTLYTTLIKYL